MTRSPHADLDWAQQSGPYDEWYRAKVAAALADSEEAVPHDQVMSEMDAIIAAAEKRNQRQA